MTTDSPSPKPVWQSETSHPEKTAELRAAWSEVMDPELALNILQLGLIREVEIRADGALVRMILTTPFCPYGPALLENARQKAERVLGVPVVMELGAEAWNPAMMDEESGADWGLLF
jgi:metal-sulfur cluster biosynthetic enzyme